MKERNLQIVADYKSGYSKKALEEKYHIGKTQIYKILNFFGAVQGTSVRLKAKNRKFYNNHRKPSFMVSENYLSDFDES